MRGRQRPLALRPDRSQHAFHVLANPAIPEAQHPDAVLRQKRSPAFVVFASGRQIVLTSVQLDSQACLRTVEVQHVWPHAVLPAEFQARQLAILQLPPKRSFCPRCPPSEIAGQRRVPYGLQRPLTPTLSPPGRGSRLRRLHATHCKGPSPQPSPRRGEGAGLPPSPRHPRTPHPAPAASLSSALPGFRGDPPLTLAHGCTLKAV